MTVHSVVRCKILRGRAVTGGLLMVRAITNPRRQIILLPLQSTQHNSFENIKDLTFADRKIIKLSYFIISFYHDFKQDC